MRLKKKNRVVDQALRNPLPPPTMHATATPSPLMVSAVIPGGKKSSVQREITTMERLEMTLGQCIVCKSEADLLICALCSEGVKVARNAYLADLQSLIEGDLI